MISDIQKNFLAELAGCKTLPEQVAVLGRLKKTILKGHKELASFRHDERAMNRARKSFEANGIYLGVIEETASALLEAKDQTSPLIQSLIESIKEIASVEKNAVAEARADQKMELALSEHGDGGGGDGGKDENGTLIGVRLPDETRRGGTVQTNLARRSAIKIFMSGMKFKEATHVSVDGGMIEYLYQGPSLVGNLGAHQEAIHKKLAAKLAPLTVNDFDVEVRPQISSLNRANEVHDALKSIMLQRAVKNAKK